MLRLSVAILAAAAVSCGEGSKPVDPVDGGGLPDTATDTPADLGSDVAADALPDAPADAAQDTDVSVGEPRTFAMGFTTFPHAATSDAVDGVFARIGSDADMISFHFDDGVPWQEALDGSPYPTDYVADRGNEVARAPSGHARFVSVTPISPDRAALAPFLEREPLTGTAWAGKAFDDPDVVAAFIQHCTWIIQTYDPDYFAYSIEANLLLQNNAALWDGYIELARQVYATLKTAYPALPIFPTIKDDAFWAGLGVQGPEVIALLEFSDVVAVSSYPISVFASPMEIANEWYSGIAGLVAKPLAVAETGWPGESSGPPLNLVSTADLQSQYVARLLDEADARGALFVNWFVSRDYDELYDAWAPLLDDEGKRLFQFWRDQGLWDGDGAERPALATWRTAVARPRE